MLVAIAMLLGVESVQAQRYKFKEYRQEHGLANLAVTSLIEDGDGYLWVGTQNGLFRHDGVAFVRFGTHEGLPGSFILALNRGPDGTLWVNTHLGIARYRDGHFVTEYRYFQSADSSGLGIAVNAQGDLFAASPSGIMVGRRSGAKTTYQFRLAYLPPAQRVKSIFQIALDELGRAWFGCGDGLCILDADGKLEIRGREAGIPAARWDGIHLDQNQTWWLRSGDRLLTSTDGGSQFENVPSAPPAQDLPHIFAGKQGRLYFPASNGLWTLDASRRNWNRISASNGVNGELITAVLGDREDNVWIGFLGDGLARWLGHGNALLDR